jgi:hypothetical protein
VAVLAWGGWQKHRATVAVAALTEIREKIIHDALVETTRRINAQVEITNALTAELRRVRSDAAAADIAGRGLRDRARAIAAACGASAAATGGAASAPEYLLADVLGRLEEAGRELALTADERGAAGAACQRLYNSLSVTNGTEH